jgi:hypothetical protein
MQVTMNRDERDKLRQEVYEFWYNEKDVNKKETLQRVLDLIDFTNESMRKLREVSSIFSSML